MDLKFSFRHIISHTLPGIFFSLELLALLNLTRPDQCEVIIKIVSTAGGFILLLVVGSFFGVIIDAFQHLIFECEYSTRHCFKAAQRLEKLLHLPESTAAFKDVKRYEKPAIQTTEQLEIYDSLVNDEFYYYYEAWMNTAISLSLLWILVPWYFNKWQVWPGWMAVAVLLVTVVLLVLLYEATITYYDYLKHDAEVLDSFSTDSKKS